MRRSRLAACLLLLLGLSGTAIPLEPAEHPLDGRVRFADATVAGELAMVADAGALEVRGTPAAFALRASEADLTIVTVVREYLDQPASEWAAVKVEDFRASHGFSEAEVVLEGTAAPAVLYVVPERAGSASGSIVVPLGHVVGHPFRPTGAVAVFGLGDPGHAYAYEHRVEAAAFGVADGLDFPGGPLAADLPSARGSGRLMLALDNLTLTIQDARGTQTFALGEWTEDSTAAGPLAARHRSERTYALLRVYEAEMDLDLGDADARFLAPRPTYHLQGRAVFDAVGGALDLNGTRVAPGRSFVDVAGNLTIRPSASAEEGGLLPLQGRPGRLEADLGGNATYVGLNGRAVVLDVPEVVRAASLLALLASAFAALWGTLQKAAAPALFPLYARLVRREALDCEVRMRLYEAVRDHPFIHLRALHRKTRLAYGTTAYHLHVLTKEGFVGSVRFPGREHFYLAVPGFPREAMARLAALADPNRERIVRALLASGSLTQNELCAVLGLGQSLLSRHLGRLCQDGLVECSGARNKRYVPSLMARAWLAAHEAVPARPSIAGSAAAPA